MSNNINTPPEINIETIIARRKREWIAEARKTISIQERIATSVPWWLIIIAVALLSLSAGHTVGLFNEVSPIGYAAPFAVEFALLWAAFSRASGSRFTLALRSIEILAFITAIFANGIGAIARVSDMAHLSSFSWNALWAVFGNLPLISQGALFFVPLFGLFIPIGTLVAGEGLAQLFLDQQKTGGLLELKWQRVEQHEGYRALFAELIRIKGRTEAKKEAESIMSGYTRTRIAPMSANTTMDVTRPMSTIPLSSPVRLSAGGGKNGRRADARFVVRAYLQDNPDSVRMSVRELARTLGVGKTIAHEEKIRYMADHGMIVDEE